MTKEEFNQNLNKFLNHPFIKSIENTPKWTFSDNNKRPIDMYLLEYRGKICGASYTDEKSLVTLPRMMSIVPEINNNAFFLDALIDDFVVLDIEPKCPEKIKETLLKLPYIYGEKSMSGKGYHLVFPLPKHIIKKYPNAMQKIVMKENHGYYEILLNHWCTFTRNMLPDAPESSTDNFEEFFEELCREQKEVVKTQITVKSKPDLAIEKIPYYEKIMELLQTSAKNYKKTVSDFYGDASRYEYAFLGMLHYKLKQILEVSAIKETAFEYNENIKAWLIYLIAKDHLEYRDKHEESRNLLPWLLYLASEVIAKDNASKSKKKGDSP